MYTIVTGAAGFIGSNLVRALNQKGINKIIAVDHLKQAEKFKNLVGLDIADYLDKHEFLDYLNTGALDSDIAAIFHEGACSNTMETDGAYMMENNYRYSSFLLYYFVEQEIPFIYASSAATYGANNVFVESFENEAPLNIYGYSKYLFDQKVRRILNEMPCSQIVGCRYFNVYGYNEFHKGKMASVAMHNFFEFKQNGFVELFEGSEHFLRDFIFVEDVVRVNLHFLEHPEINGIFNVGTGRAQSFVEVSQTVINTLLKFENKKELTVAELKNQNLLRFKPCPDSLKGKYQSFTEANLNNLRQNGKYTADFLSVYEGVSRYTAWLLENDK